MIVAVRGDGHNYAQFSFSLTIEKCSSAVTSTTSTPKTKLPTAALLVSNKIPTFAPVKQNVLTYQQNGEQKSRGFSASFNAHCLVVSEKMTTLHTHTHTHTHTQRTYLVV